MTLIFVQISDEAIFEQYCNCGLLSSVTTVKKNGPNYGRNFQSCPKPFSASDRCNFFQFCGPKVALELD